MSFFLGIDVGSSKTHALIVDETGRVVGIGSGGAGNHETVGYDGLERVLRDVTGQALAQGGLALDQIAGAGLGLAGLDWDMELDAHLARIRAIGLAAPVEAVNDALIGLAAAASDGWGIAVVSGTGCNCRGWDRGRRRRGQMTGASSWMGEGAGATELMGKAIQAVAHAWTRRGPATAMTDVFMAHTRAPSVPHLLHGLAEGCYVVPPSLAPYVFTVAEQGDAVARELIAWAGRELGEMVNAVVRQLEFQALDFDVVLLGSMFNGGPRLTAPLAEPVRPVAPGARFVRLNAPPVAGAVLLGMELGGIDLSTLRPRVLESVRAAFAANGD